MLRDYQTKAVEEIRNIFLSGKKRVVLHLATGAGKTVIFTHIMNEAMNRGKRSLMVVRGRKLVSQASQRLYREGISHGVLMSGHWAYFPTSPIQLASVDTLHARQLKPQADLIIIDEVHMATSNSYKQFLSKYPDAFVLGVTATPYSKKGLSHIADAVAHPITIQDLTDQGYLVPLRYFAPSTPDLTGVEVSSSTGDYKQDQLARAMEKRALVGDIVSHWKKFAEGRPTLCFGVDIKHSHMIRDQFVEAGVKCEHQDASTSDEEREDAIKRLESGDIQVLCNVGIYCTGVDIPTVSCLILARPTKSYNLHIQQLGRGTRIADSKVDCLILDHAGNTLEHGMMIPEPKATLYGYESGDAPRLYTCPLCYAISDKPINHATPCPACAAYFCKHCKTDFNEPFTECPKCHWRVEASSGRHVEYKEGELVEMKPIHQNLDVFQAEQHCELALKECIAKEKNPWRAFYSTKENYGEALAKLVFFRLCKRFNIQPHKVTGTNVARRGQTPVREGLEARDGHGTRPGWPFK